MTDVVDAEVVDGQELVHVEQPPTALFRTDDPVEVVEQATKVANALANVIQTKQLFTKIQGKSHVQVEGWQLLGSMLGVTAVCVATEPIDGGYKATVEARTADGRVVGRADALCTKHEKRGPWKSADDYARLSMAQTRATSKALKGPLGFVVSLAGYQTTPAEEMTFAEPDPQPAPAAPAGDVIAAGTVRALFNLFKASKVSPGDLKSKLSELKVAGGYSTIKGALALLNRGQAARLETWLEERRKMAESDVPPDTEGL